MYAELKKTLTHSPLFLKRLIVCGRESWWRLYCRALDVFAQKNQPRQHHDCTDTKEARISSEKVILIYSLHGLYHAGTERNLQLVANALADSSLYTVLFVYGNKSHTPNRQKEFHPNITLIPFSYNLSAKQPPHYIRGMSPLLSDIIHKHNPHLIITSSPGYAHHPWNMVRDIPIVLLNIFGVPTLQKNIAAVIYNSHTTKNHAQTWIGNDARGQVQYAPVFNTPPHDMHELGERLREKLKIPQDDFVFGRIGRDDDSIFDPIALDAWKSIAETYPNAHYLVMSPPPKLIKYIAEKNIPRVHLLEPSAAEKDVWSFHGAIDAMAHARYDGETSGVAIAESLMAGNPVITHRSHIWNAHTEYLHESCSSIVSKDDVSAYAHAMIKEMELKKSPLEWKRRQESARETARQHFSPEKYSTFILNTVSDVLH